MLALQTTTTVAPIVVQGTDWWTVGISAFAVTLAAAVGILTVLQGRAIRNIETREHKWEAQDRISAHIQVTRESYQAPTDRTPHGTTANVASFTNRWLIRLTNTGRATANNVQWAAYHDDDEIDLLTIVSTNTHELPKLHPGEHFDLPTIQRTELGEDALTFSVTWDDEGGGDTTTRLINW